MIIVSVTGPTMSGAFEQVRTSDPFTDLFEFRLDMIAGAPLSLLLSSTRKPVIATCRKKDEGGMFAGTESERVEILKAAAILGAEYVDLEHSTDKRIIAEFVRNENAKVILSHHSFGSKIPRVPSLYARMRSTGADVLKFAYEVSDSADIRHAVEFLEIAKRDRQKAVAIAMGGAGESSRILYKKFGGWATYAAAEVGKEAAPGQISARQLRVLYNSERLTRRTKVFGVIGNPIGQSKGVYLHNPLFHRGDIDAVYCRFPVHNLAAFMKHVAPLLTGFSVTIPHKQAVMRYLDRVDETARAIGAVNTVVRKRGYLYGTNTDAAGALDAIEKVMRVNRKTLLVFGAGGAARAIAFEAKRRGAIVHISNRTAKRGMQLARELGLSFVDRKHLSGQRFEIVVNATSVGMTPDVNRSPLPKALLKKKLVFDAVYNPPMTKLLTDAKSAGGRVVSGTEMYINQAALQSELYTGKKPDVTIMKKILSQV